ncbi:glycosyltransferase family 61 protein [Elizabethkingia anophelis]|uniref:glycosyltransferase family 61 protein n=1 Tax=Elizabethkingia anophelis TaxID=1117645 RepID=UPI0038926F4B|nr:glycosyltransferase family 61 protein [Elizabethkingia anophelis]
MKPYDINSIHKILLWKKRKYKVTSLFVKPKTYIVDFIPINKTPRSFCQTTITIEKSKVNKTYLPQTLQDSQNPIEVTQPEIIAYHLKNIIAASDSTFFITADMKAAFYEKLHEDNRDIYIYNDSNILFHSHSLARIKSLPFCEFQNDALFLGGLFTFNYYHFLIEILSKTEYIKHIPGGDSLTIVLDSSIQENKNLKYLADIFLKNYKIVYLKKDLYYSFKNLWFINNPNPTIPNISDGSKYEASFTNIKPSSILYLRKICLESYNEKQISIKPIKRVFIARKSGFRRYNESDLLEIAKKYEFQAVYFEDLSINEQIFIIQNADYILGASGAAWTNILFALPHSKGLTWLGSVWGDFSVFSTLAKLVDFDLYFLRYESKTSHFHEDYTIQPDIFERHIIKLIEL